MDNNKRVWKQGLEVGRAGVVVMGTGKGRKLYLNNNKKMFKKEDSVRGAQLDISIGQRKNQ